MSPARSIALGERLEPRHVLSGFGVIEPLAASPAGDAADPVPVVFTTSNQVPAGGTILASPVEPTNIGRAQSFLEAMPGVARISVPASKGGIDFTLDVLDVPRETSLYKALKIPASGLFQQDDVLNRFAVSTNWYSSLDVASNYADSDWGRSQGYQVVEFAAPKALRLIDLGDDDTLGYVWASLESDVAWTESQLASLQGADPPTTNPQAVEIVTQKLAELRRDMEIVQLTTGFNASYATQLDLLLTYGDAITNDFTYHPGTEIARRGSSPSDTFIVETATTSVWRPATLVTGTTSDPVDLVTWGGTIDDLNRISFTTDIDKELTSILGTYLNVDGYFATELPSLFHRDGRLIEEIGLFLPRDSTAIVPQPTIDPRPAIDLNGDGLLDGLWREATTGLVVGTLYDADGRAAGTRILGGDADWTIGSPGDFDGDGVTDVIWLHSSGLGVMRIHNADGSTRSSDVIGASAEWGIEASGDFDGDGRSDVVWRHDVSGTTVMWLMDGAATTQQTLLGGDTDWRLVATGPGFDANADGTTDLIWRHAPSGTHVVKRMMGASEISATVLGGSSDWEIVATGDFDTDGYGDLLWRQASTGTVVQWLLVDAALRQAAWVGGNLDWSVVATEDADGDGRSDIIWRQASTGVNLTRLMEGTLQRGSLILGGDQNWSILRWPGRQTG